MTNPTAIRSLAPRFCPQCKAELSFKITPDKIECRQCGYIVRREDGQPDKPVVNTPTLIQPESPEAKAKRLKAALLGGLTMRGPVESWARAAYDTGTDMIRQENWDEALKAFRRSAEYQDNFVDAHLWIARLTDDPAEKRRRLEEVLAYDLNHMEATRELMILRGELAADAPAFDPYVDVRVMVAGGAVATTTQNLRCPRCGSPGMTTDEMTGLITCGSCSYVDEAASGRTAASVGMLSMALLKRAAQPVVWVVGERLLHCNSCGAERTIPAGRLSERCPYCGSNHVIQKDALNTFQQPDGLVPFGIWRAQAGDLIKERLGGWMERVSGWFGDNTVKRATLEGVYLPYWAFDAAVEIQRTTVRESFGIGYSRQHQQRNAAALGYQTETLYDALNDVLVCGVKSPAPLLTRKLGTFDLDAKVAYDPQHLATHAAQLYDIDFDKASLEARSRVGDAMRERHTPPHKDGVRVSVFSSVKNMTFQLLLLPVWVGTLYEADGDVRTALVNGQTGRVALGKARRGG
ncbi:MAG: TFIIB-type zinc ribbon-containing protein [bacterium]|nr:TFIIB-type zinc ribbon-containing protein [bacterium]